MGDFYPASLFVSYSHADKAIVLPLVEMNEDLQEAAWIDYKHTPIGSEWTEAHRRAIEKSYRLVLLWSRNSAGSLHVEREWKWALQHNTRVVPVLLDDTPLPPELENTHAVSLREYVSKGKNRLSLRRFPPMEWVGLGTAFDTFAFILSGLGLIAVDLVLIFAINSDWIILNILGWIASPFLLYFSLSYILYIRIEVNRYKLRHRLSRIVVQSLKEWGYENRKAGAGDR